MLKSEGGASKASQGKRLGCLFPIIAFVTFPLVGYVFTSFVQPQRLAKVQQCIAFNTSSLAYSNSCDFDINIQYCFWSKEGPEKDVCFDEHLAPGRETRPIGEHLAKLGGLLNDHQIACKAPYLPGRTVHPNNKQWRPGCLKEGHENIGPHVSRTLPKWFGQDMSTKEDSPSKPEDSEH